MPSIKQVRFYVPSLLEPLIGERAILHITVDPHKQIAPNSRMLTSPVAATFHIPGIGLGILTQNTLYLPDRREPYQLR